MYRNDKKNVYKNYAAHKFYTKLLLTCRFINANVIGPSYNKGHTLSDLSGVRYVNICESFEF